MKGVGGLYCGNSGAVFLGGDCRLKNYVLAGAKGLGRNNALRSVIQINVNL